MVARHLTCSPDAAGFPSQLAANSRPRPVESGHDRRVRPVRAWQTFELARRHQTATAALEVGPILRKALGLVRPAKRYIMRAAHARSKDIVASMPGVLAPCVKAAAQRALPGRLSDANRGGEASKERTRDNVERVPGALLVMPRARVALASYSKRARDARRVSDQIRIAELGWLV